VHTFHIHTAWTGNTGEGTSSYRSYKRDHEFSGAGKAQPILGSSDPKYRGDGARYNPEELLVGALSACHMLWMLHLCADAGIVVTDYQDDASGDVVSNPDGSGQFAEAVLRPSLKITDASRAQELEALHHRAHELCFIARSVNFPVRVEPRAVRQ
jgi:organic hydroperoxide reductase OsmC/OhrA